METLKGDSAMMLTNANESQLKTTGGLFFIAVWRAEASTLASAGACDELRFHLRLPLQLLRSCTCMCTCTCTSTRDEEELWKLVTTSPLTQSCGRVLAVLSSHPGPGLRPGMGITGGYGGGGI